MIHDKGRIAAALLDIVTDARRGFAVTLTDEERELLRNRHHDDDTGSAVVYAAGESEEALQEFELLAALDALEHFTGDMRMIVERRKNAAYLQGLEVYYRMAELAKEPEHAALIRHVTAMREAHVASYGFEIPEEGSGVSHHPHYLKE